MDYVRERGGAALGARLRRLSETIDGDAERIYARLGVRFEQRWFGVLNQLRLLGSSTVGELAAALGITHASVSQTRGSLEREGLVGSEPDPGDRRSRRLVLTAEGSALVERLSPVWAAFEAASEELDAEADGVAAALDRLTDALARRPLAERILARLPLG
jgi:DNA-binding MarR family transcriptional regulator